MNYSSFGQKFYRRSGITVLMDDLNKGLRTPGTIMLGGGNPATIPTIEAYLRRACSDLLADGSLTHAICNYDGPQGQTAFIQSLATMLQERYGWSIGPQNITLTNGSQSSFFYLFNILAGRQRPDGENKKIILPLAPEYIGYGDVGIDENIFVGCAPKVEMLGERLFKYHIDFDNLPIDENIAAICVSRPTNPTGNVLTDEEIQRLNALACQYRIPLILDNAYGTPFPNIIFNDVRPFWNDNTIVCLSLSKLGLPGLRCGIVIANPELSQVLANINGITSLAPGSIGPTLGHYMIKRGDLLELSREIVQPFYREKSLLALDIAREQIRDERVCIHKPEGAIFLWLWFQDLPITTMELYRRLKARGVMIVPGEYFFPGFNVKTNPLPHQCLRMNYVQEPALLRKGIEIIGEEVKNAYNTSAT